VTACDLAIAVPGAKFGYPEVRRGLVAAMVMPHSNCWFRVPEAISIELVGQPKPGTTARDVALWLCATIGEGKGNYYAIKFHGEYIASLPFWDRWLSAYYADRVVVTVAVIRVVTWPDHACSGEPTVSGEPLPTALTFMSVQLPIASW
jgi:hypothetical protein